MDDILPIVINYGVKVIGVFVLFWIGLKLASWAQRSVAKRLASAEFDPTLSAFFSKMVRWFVILAVIMGCLGIFDVDTTSLAAVLGAAGFAIGLAFQGTLSNFSAGVMLLVFRPFKIGDYVNTGGQAGSVVEIGLFTITLDTLDNRRIIIPNSTVFGATIENLNHNEVRRCDVNVGTDYGADIDQTRQVLEAVAAKVQGMVQDPAPQVFLAGLGGSSIDWQVRVWCKPVNYWDVLQQTTRDVKVGLDAAEISIPYPQMDVHMDSAS